MTEREGYLEPTGHSSLISLQHYLISSMDFQADFNVFDFQIAFFIV
jgi:hypothetical protein